MTFLSGLRIVAAFAMLSLVSGGSLAFVLGRPYHGTGFEWAMTAVGALLGLFLCWRWRHDPDPWDRRL